MNAWIQRLQLLLRIGMAAGLALWAWPEQGAWAALAWALLGFWAYGLILALGFVALHWVNRAEPAGRPGLVQLLVSAWREFWVCERVFAWLQPFRAEAEPDHLPAQPNGRRGVLLLHGYSCNRGLWNSWLRRLRAQGHACVAPTLEPAYGSIDAYADLIEAALQRLERATGQPPLVVAHSMGGLALRAWWRRHGGGRPERLHRVVTLGSPHHGTLLAAVASTPNGRQMRRGGDWLQQLEAGESADFRARLLCVYSNADQVVYPAGTAVLSGTEARHLAGRGHLQLAFDPQVWAWVQAELGAAA